MTPTDGTTARPDAKVAKVYRWRILRSQIQHRGFWWWLLRRLR